MEIRKNPLLQEKVDLVFDLKNLDAVTILRRKRKDKKRELRDQRRTATAREAIEGFDRETCIYGFTKGQFSLVELIAATLEIIGPAHFTIST